MTGMQWDERQYAELTKERELTPYEAYRIGRDTPAPYVEPQKPSAPAEPPVFDYQMKRFAAAGSVMTVFIVAIETATSGAAMAAAAIAWQIVLGAMGIGIGILAIRLTLSGITHKQETSNQPPPGNSGEWEFYQEQRQGWRKKQ